MEPPKKSIDEITIKEIHALKKNGKETIFSYKINMRQMAQDLGLSDHDILFIANRLRV